MLSLKYNKGGFFVTILRVFGFGLTKADVKNEKSTTIVFKAGKFHTFFTLAWIS